MPDVPEEVARAMDQQASVGAQRAAAEGVLGQVRCPACSKLSGIPILYGMPIGEAAEAARRGEIHIGGCVVSGQDPTHHCRACDHEFTPEGDPRT